MLLEGSWILWKASVWRDSSFWYKIIIPSFIFIFHPKGPETSEVVLVSAAHCNFMCKVLFIELCLRLILKIHFEGQR